MKLSIISELISNDIVLNFDSMTVETICEKAKELAIVTDAVFNLNLSPTGIIATDPNETPNDLECKEITLSSLISFLSLDDDAKTTLQDIYTASNMLGENKDKVSVSQMLISCSGQIKLSINAPEIDSGISIDSSGSGNLKIGLGFTFKSTKSAFFVPEDMSCQDEIPA